MDEISIKIPKYLIFDFSEEINQFKSVVCDLSMPTVDIESALEQIIDSVQNLNTVEHDINIIGFHMAQGEGLYENSELDDGAQENIMKAVITIGEKITDKLHHAGAYISGQFPYKFRSLEYGGAIVFSKI